jgi:APA family basic amino acid/polyamine antiporter
MVAGIVLDPQGGMNQEDLGDAMDKRSLFYKKPIQELTGEFGEGPHELKRVLGPMDLTLLGVGAIIGAGIFVITGQAAAQYAGPGIVLSFVLSATACIFAGLCYAEFASMIPAAGSAYTYAYAALGQIFAMIIGWDLVLEYLFAMATVAVGWSGYAVSFLKDFSITIPAGFTGTPFGFAAAAGWHGTGALVNTPAMLIIGLLTLLVAVGIRESAQANRVIVAIKITAILLFIGFGFLYMKPDNWTPFIPQNTGEFGIFGWSGVLRGAAVVFFAYIGFDAVSTAAQETKNPQRNMPIGILLSLGVCTILYILVALVLTGLIKYDQLNVPDPIAAGLNAAGPSLFWLRPVVKIGAIAGLSSVLLVQIIAQSRIFYAMSTDRLLPSFFSVVHPKFRTPVASTAITGVAAMLLAGFLPISVLGEMVSIGTLFAFAVVCISVLVLRYTSPEIPRPFKAPFFPMVPILGTATALLQVVSLPLNTWLRFLVWFAIGMSIYFFYARRKHFR